MGTSKFIKNVSGSTINYNHGDIANNETWEFPSSAVLSKIVNTTSLETDILNGDVVVVDNTLELSPTIGFSWLKYNSPTMMSSLAIDKDGTNQDLTTDDWELVTADRVLWDINEDYVIADNDFLVPIDAIYKFDCNIRVYDLSNVAEIELAIFKRGDPDDYWFIIDRQYPSILNLTEVVLGKSIAFDMYKDELFCMKIKMTKVVALTAISATIDGNDDYTAWGYDLSKKL